MRGSIGKLFWKKIRGCNAGAIAEAVRTLRRPRDAYWPWKRRYPAVCGAFLPYLTNFIMPIKTNWYVVTGGPSSGKSKTLEHLAFLGYPIITESARVLIDNELSKGKTIQEIRKDEKKFQIKIFDLKVQAEDRTPKNRLTFFERGIPDSLAYYRLHKQEEAPVIKASQSRKYKGIFLLEQLPFDKDYARTEDGVIAKKLSQLIYEAYIEMGYKVIKVPVMPIDKRIKFILDRMSRGRNAEPQ